MCCYGGWKVNYQFQDFLRLSLPTPYQSLQEAFLEVGQLSETHTAHSKGGVFPRLNSKKMRPAHMANSLTGTKTWQGEGHTKFKLKT